MLTASDVFKIRMSQAGAQPVYIVELHLSPADVRYYSTSPITGELTGLSDILIDASLSDVVGVSSSIDIVSRAVSIGEVHLVFVDDGVARKLIKDNLIFGKKVVVKLGTADMDDYADFLPVAVAVVRDCIPAEGEVTVECADMLDLLMGRKIGPRYWINGHPLEIIEDILEAIGIDSSYYDAATLSPFVDMTRSHFVVSRYDAKTTGLDERILSNGVNDVGADAVALIEELSDLMWGTFAPDEEGVFKFKYYDATAPEVRGLTEADLGEVSQLTTGDPLYNKVTMELARISRIYGDDPRARTWFARRSRDDANIGFSQTDSISAANYGFLGNSPGERELSIGTNWVMGPARINAGYKVVSGTLTDEIDITSVQRAGMGTNGKRASIMPDHDAIVISDAAYNGFCGCTFDLGTITASARQGQQVSFPHNFPVKSMRGISSERPAYLLIEGLATEYVYYGKVKTYAALGSTEIELEDVNLGNIFVGANIRIADDNRTNPKTLRGPGYVVQGFTLATNVLRLHQPIQYEALVGAMVIVNTGSANGIPLRKEQFRSEVIKCTEAVAHSQVGTGGHSFVSGRHLKTFPGGDGCLGPWDTRTQRMEKSRDIAITSIGKCPTAVTHGGNYIWPYLTLYNHRYPVFTRFRFEGTSGNFGTDISTGHTGIGSSPSGRGQFGTKMPYRWNFVSPEISPGTNTYQESGADGLYYARAWDVTILVDNVNRRLQRFKNGCPKLSFRTGLLNADLQLGDFVTISTDLYSAYGEDGTNHGAVFEIISKTVDALADSPGCTFEVAWVRNSGVPYPTSAYTYGAYVCQRGQQTATNNNVYTLTVVGGAVEPVLTESGIEVTTTTHRSL